MEKKYTHPANGDEFRMQDVDSISENAALSDDRVLWELLRTKAGSATPDKLIIPYTDRQLSTLSGASSHALVWGNTANGSVRVMPFRAIVGSTTVIGTSPTEHMRGQRSGYYVGSSALYTTVPIAANASGNPRWTLVYAVVTPDTSGDTASLLNKDPTTKVVSTNTRTINTKTTVTVTTTDGTPAVSPTFPSLPADGAGSYNIPLAYVRVNNGFNASSTVQHQYIHEVAPCPAITPAVGASSLSVADEGHKTGGTVDTRQNARLQERPGAYLPSTMTGCEQVVALFQFGLSPASHQDGDYVDRSRDWRFRYFKWSAAGRRGTTSAAAFATDYLFSGTDPVPDDADAVEQGFGHSFYASTGAPAGTYGPVMALSGSATTKILGNAGGTVKLWVNDSDGSLIVKTSGTVDSQIIVWIEATSPFSNFGTI